VGKDPGQYGPTVPSDDADTEQGSFDANANDEAQKIQSLASHENPVNPAWW
jgi:hypothetical protein